MNFLFAIASLLVLSAAQAQDAVTTAKPHHHHSHQTHAAHVHTTHEAKETDKYSFVYDGKSVCTAGASKTQTAKLQRVQNVAARIVTRCGNNKNITPILYTLHSLPGEHDLVVKTGDDCYIMPLTDKQRTMVHDPAGIKKVEAKALKLIIDNSVQTTVDQSVLDHHLAHYCKGSTNIITLANN